MEDTRVLFHGTNNLEEILRDGAILCYSLAGSGLTDGSLINYRSQFKEYERLTSQIAKECRDGKFMQKRKCHNLSTKAWLKLNDETLADYFCNSIQRTEEEINLWSNYKEYERVLFVWLTTNKQLAKNYAEKPGGAVLELNMPKELIRKRLYTNAPLVKEKVPLTYLSKVYVENYKLLSTTDMLAKYNFRNVRTEAM